MTTTDTEPTRWRKKPVEIDAWRVAELNHAAGHDWHAVQAVWRPGLDWFGERTGLGEMAKSLKEYPQVEVLQ